MRKNTLIIFIVLLMLVGCSNKNEIAYNEATKEESSQPLLDEEENKETKPYDESLLAHIDTDDAEYYFSLEIKNSIIDEVVKYNDNIIEFLGIKEKSIFVIQDSSLKINISSLNNLQDKIIYIETYKKDLFDFNLEKTFLSSYPYLTEFFSIYFERFNYVIEDANIDLIDIDIDYKNINPHVFTLDQIFSFDKINSVEQVAVYNELVLDFINNMLRHLENDTNIDEIRADSIKLVFDKNKTDLDLFLSKVHLKWLEEIYEKNNIEDNLKENLSKIKYTVRSANISAITPDDNLATISLSCFNKEVAPGVFSDIYYFYKFINSIDTKKERVINFLSKEDLYENYSKRTVIDISSNQDISFADRGGNTIYLSVEGVMDSFLHELTHTLLKEHDALDIQTDSFRNVYEEGLAEYIQFTFDENTLIHRNICFLHSNNNERFSKIYKRKAIISYLNYEDGSLTLDDYINATTYLSLTDSHYLEDTTKRFSNSENTALRTYEESHSFVKYIINTYGEEAFFKLRRREESYQDIFKKSYLDILNEWLDFLEIRNDDTTLNIKEFENVLN